MQERIKLEEATARGRAMEAETIQNTRKNQKSLRVGMLANMKTLLVILISVIGFGISANAQDTQANIKDTAEVSTGDNYALLHIYRKGSMAGIAVSYDLHVEEQVICRVKNKWKETIKIYKEGEIVLWAHTEVRKEFPITIEFGKEYYIRCGLKFGAVVGRPHLELMDEKIGMTEFESIKEK